MLLEIVTPEKKVYSEQVESVVLPTVEGEVGILPGHIPLLTMLDLGELQVAAKGKVESLAVDKGFAQVYGDKVSVLTEAAINVEEIDLSEVEKAQERAEKALEEAEKEGMDPAEIEQLENLVRFSLQQKLLKRKRK
jgi:F-type H+-transporting ATPase subunit epsilon